MIQPAFGSAAERPPVPAPAGALYESTLPVFGVPVRLRSNEPEPIAAFERSLGRWRVLEGSELLSEVRVDGALWVAPGGEGSDRPIPVTHAVQEHGRVTISSPGSLVRSDSSARAFEGWVTPELLREDERFRYQVLEAAVLSVVTHLDRQPLHASAVVRDGTALLVSGPSGTGKSTLAYAAARAGLQVLSEDTVFVQLRPRLRVWGMSQALNLSQDARRHFAELADAPLRTLPTGKQKISVGLAALGAEASPPFVERAGICIAHRAPGSQVTAEPIDGAVLEEFLRRGEPGFHLFDHARGELAGALAPGGAWRLTLSDDPDAAIPVLHRLLDQVEERLAAVSSP